MASAPRRATDTTVLERMTLSAPASAVAMSTSDLLNVATRELQREQKASKGNQRIILRNGIERLSDAGVVSKWERKSLDRICDLILVEGRSAKAAEDVNKRLQAIYDEMIDRDAGPLALTIAEVAANRDRLSGTRQSAGQGHPTPRADNDPNLGHLMIGGIAGALAGLAAGGPLGAGIGFVAGWVGRGLFESC
jgi:hypothetical protein